MLKASDKLIFWTEATDFETECENVYIREAWPDLAAGVAAEELPPERASELLWHASGLPASEVLFSVPPLHFLSISSASLFKISDCFFK